MSILKLSYRFSKHQIRVFKEPQTLISKNVYRRTGINSNTFLKSETDKLALLGIKN